jgi:steroid 5-alpha reductase family enzyme
MTTLEYLLYGQAGCSIVMFIGWAVAIKIKNASYVDVLWAYGVGMLGLYFLTSQSSGCDPGRLALFQGLVGVWSILLVTHLIMWFWV